PYQANRGPPSGLDLQPRQPAPNIACRGAAAIPAWTVSDRCAGSPCRRRSGTQPSVPASAGSSSGSPSSSETGPGLSLRLTSSLSLPVGSSLITFFSHRRPDLSASARAFVKISLISAVPPNENCPPEPPTTSRTTGSAGKSSHRDRNQ